MWNDVTNRLAFGNGVTAVAVGGLAGAGILALTSSGDSLPVTLSVGGNGQNTTYNGSLSGQRRRDLKFGNGGTDAKHRVHQCNYNDSPVRCK